MNSNNSKWKQLLGYQTNTDKILFYKCITKRY